MDHPVGVDSQIGLHAVDIRSLDLLAQLYIVEVAIDRMRWGRGLIEIGPHSDLAPQYKVLLGRTVLARETHWGAILKGRCLAVDRGSQPQEQQ
ncbi:MAG: hypothetical protein ACJ0UT_05175 [Candidatus Latescibacterota bacterium]